jgi:IclR family KDG regulon transcriptional repressor
MGHRPKKRDKQKMPINTLERAFTLLDCFTAEHPELGVREAARMVNLSSSATGRLLSAMKELGVLRQNPVSRTYALGGRVLAWAGVYMATLDVRDRALPVMDELHRVTRETISLYVLEGDERVCVERMESTENVRIVQRVGRRLPLYAGSAGKVFLAFLPPWRRDEILARVPMEPLTPSTIVDHDSMLDELKRIRQTGYAISFGEWITEASGVAAPVFNQKGEIIAALTISGPTQRFTEEKVMRYASEVTRVANQISQEMGYTAGVKFAAQEKTI